jgi:hypothetical protein
LLFAIVGDVAVFQHTPRASTGDPPSLVMFPPLVAVMPVIALNATVLMDDDAAPPHVGTFVHESCRYCPDTPVGILTQAVPFQ